MNHSQLSLFPNGTIIETVSIQPTKDMPIEVFRECYHISYFMELMEKLPDGRRVWDETVSDIVAEGMADVCYHGLQNDFFITRFEMPKEVIDRWSKT